MGSTVVFPDGTKARHHRPFDWAIVQGPSEREAFLTQSTLAVIDLERVATEVASAADRAVLVRDTDNAWLDGWDDYRIAHFGRDQVRSFFYLPNSLDTEHEPRWAPIDQILVNHARAHVWGTRNRAGLLQRVALQVAGGDTAPLGAWSVVKWCKTQEIAIQALPEFEQRRVWGSSVYIVQTHHDVVRSLP